MTQTPTTFKRAPVRIQVWVGDNMRLDIRGWMDEFDVQSDLQPIDALTPGRFQDARREYKLTAHNDATDRPWRFERGKPKVAS